ncbi:hypothetical protein PENANT_c035G07367 [Penicillium antarcticum]|uniref:Cation/H+ exchanger transmembrane domain-containing protein n=1 Tax=Penicillium antarcticum TaxID=416450 RepID=A0A1V6PTU0_9EURO|nr:hypothetical protein PENANT_c035G07367 [Penicillium antarcticum]
MASGSEAAFAYHEPSIETVLNYTGLLLVLNIIKICLDNLLYCGLIGQLFVGILWGTPGAQWLNQETERVIQQIGYLGLILLIYEGGLSTAIKSLKANILLSTAVALTGIGVPLGLSFILTELVSATSLQAFAAGAALSATSLGTTFTILSTTQLTTTRLGTVTTSAAMIDDVVGLVLVQIISNLGGGTASFSAVTVIRPVFVSLGFAVGLLLLCAFCLRPVLKKVIDHESKFPKFLRTAQFAFLAHTCVLVGIVAGATYAGTSSLFAAYLAGVIVSWFDSLVAESKFSENSSRSETSQSATGVSHQQVDSHDNATVVDINQTSRVTESSGTRTTSKNEPSHDSTPTGELIYHKYYKEPANRILLPLFFASIGFAIPITEMFQGQILEKKSSKKTGGQSGTETGGIPSPDDSNPEETLTTNEPPATNPNPRSKNRSHMSLPPNPKSLYPSSILGLAMLARGEVGYLIASIAESQGIFSSGSSSEGSSDVYLVVIWAISLCTLIGPIMVGTLVRRVKKLQKSRKNSGSESDPLGVWGI